MKHSLRALLLLCLTCFSFLAHTQCPAGYNPVSLNWDNLDFLVQDPTYISASQAQTQYFAFGTNKITVNHNYSSANTKGENATNTGEAGSYGGGEDIQFTGDGTVAVTFASAVQNVKFSVYDIDYNQRITITAFNGATAQNVTVTRLSTAQLTLGGTATAPTATGQATTAVADNSTDGTINVDIAGPVTSFTLSITQTGTKTTGPASGREDGSFWVSDISACGNTTAFPASYFAVSQPFTGQPGYVLSALDNSVLIINPANGVSRVLFTDPSGNNINSMGYDPYNKFLYYTYSLTNAGSPNPNDKSIQKYDVNTGMISTVISNVNTLGIPTYTSGVESGGAAFYDGSFYIGIEGESGGESKIWRIDFDASFNPVGPAYQVFGISTDTHDWGDFAMKDGVLYDFDGKSSSNESIYHINLQTGGTAATYNSGTLGFVPRQVAIDWTGAMYNLGTAASSSSGTVVPYSNGAINSAQQFTITNPPATPSGSWGDAAEAFKPKADFGDAPATYDPDPMAPALHEKDTSLRLGAAESIEWNKTSSVNANADTDEDGLPFVRILSNNNNYYTDVDVYNNTGANATVCGWVDFNGNGVFETGEGVGVTVASGTTTQRIQLYWPAVVTSLTDNSHTYLRIRITSASNSMTTANPTGYFYNGEVEDHYVVVNMVPLDVRLSEFSASKINDQKTSLKWVMEDEEAGTVYELQRSNDARAWQIIDQQTATREHGSVTYTYTDEAPEKPASYYRLKFTDIRNQTRYSRVQKIQFSILQSYRIYPNPASASSTLNIEVLYPDIGRLQVSDVNGRTVYEQAINIKKGTNLIGLPVVNHLKNGIYTVRILLSNDSFTQKLMVFKN